MASLPAISSFARRPARAQEPEATRLAAEVDAKLQLARRLREEDAARRSTSIAPPSRPIY
ncbi:hypothetical protein [Conexibacter woesei]|uniref:hypothetical protein n=1 Tax=Conexibacter woesei TaxID=191495 RepID=UPI0004031AE1|nr:hypothetical protein [Conexibacter woesei]